ncbi:MAG: HAMP domain-containing histidine kinase, partial [Bacteroidaceae bacterium]|nr:HAMP domain-containing histidine kinase [Bacteroidaceae bacterium]
MKRSNYLLILLAVFFLGSNVLAQNEQTLTISRSHFHYRPFSTEEGLSNQNVTCLATNNNGILWIGTDAGLNVAVNGHLLSFLKYYTETGYYDIGRVNHLACSPDSRVVLVSTDNGLLCQTIGSSCFKEVLYDNEKIIPSAVFYDNDVALILTRHKGNTIILQYEFVSESLSLLNVLDGVSSYNFTRILKVKGDDAILLADEKAGIFRLNTNSWKLSRLSHIGGNINTDAIFQDMYGTLWVAYYNEGVVGYRPDMNYTQYQVFNTGNSPLPRNNVTCITETPNSYLCFVTDGGDMAIVDKSNKLLRLAQNQYILQSNCAMSLGVNMLVGTTHNGLILVSKDDICVLNNSNLKGNSKLSNNIVLSFSQSDNAVWLGTVDGINRYDEITKEVTQYPSTAGMQVNAVTDLDSNRLLFLSLYDDFYTFDKTTAQISPFRFLGSDSDCSSIGYQNLQMFHASNNDIYIVNCNSKNYIYNCQTGEITEFILTDKDGNPDTWVGSIIPIFNGILLTTLHSIYEISGNSSIPRRLYTGSTRIYSCAADANNNLWFVNSDGLFMYNYRFNEMDMILQSFPNSYYSTLLIDKTYDKIWLATSDNHFLVYDPNSGIYNYYSQEDGLALNNRYYNYTFTSDRGILYFPGSAGLTVINPYSTMQSLQIPKSAHTLSVQINSSDNVLLSDNQNYVFPRRYSSAIVQIALNQPNPLQTSELRYCVMKGSDVVMELETTEPYLKLNNLNSGRYSLYLQMFSRNGWSDPDKIMSFYVPVSLENILAISVIVLLMAILITAQVIYLRKKSKERYNSDVQKIHKDTSNVYVRQMDELLSGILHKNITTYHNVSNVLKQFLDNISLSREQSKSIRYLIKYVDRLINVHSLIIQANSPLATSFSFEIEQVDLCKWLDNLLIDYRMKARSKGIELKTVYDPQITVVNMDCRKMEAVICILIENAITYSSGGSIQVVTSYSSLGNIKLSVIDEGCGISGDIDSIFAPHVREHSDIPGTGMSLYSVKVMMEKMGGSISAYNNLNKGATFFLYIPSTLKTDVVTGKNEDLTASSVSDIPEQCEQSDEDADPFMDQYSTINPETDFNTLGYTLLVVDDQQDNLDFLKEEYSDLFKAVYVAH